MDSSCIDQATLFARFSQEPGVKNLQQAHSTKWTFYWIGDSDLCNESYELYIDEDEVTLMHRHGHFHVGFTQTELNMETSRAATASLADRLCSLLNE